MSDRARFGTGAFAALAGSVVALRAAWLPWFSSASGGRDVDVPGLGRASLPPRVTHYTALDVSPEAPMVALIVVLALLFAFIVGRRARAAFLSGAAAGACVLAALAAGAAAPAADVVARYGDEVTLAGAAVTALGALAAIRPGLRFGRLAIPERGPEEPTPGS